MPCFHPLTGFRQPDGKVKFTMNIGKLVSPNRVVTVPCGQCIGCRFDQARSWAIRCVHEAQFHKKNSFLTLTYDDEHLPEDGGLDVRHWKNFAKQVRNKIGKFRYYHCGEYGGDTMRAHYHACIFGLDFCEDREICEMSDSGFPVYTSKSLSACWPHGYAWIGEFTFDTASYVARYCMKKLTGERAIEYGGIKPDYSTMSTRPGGLGYLWYRKYGEQAHYMDSINLNAAEMPMPRYYDRLLEKDHPEVLERLKEARIEKSKRWENDQTEERLTIRERCKQSQGIGQTRHTNTSYIEARVRQKPGIPGRRIEDYY